MWVLLRLFPLIVGHSIPENEPKWGFFLDFLQIVEQLCAQTFTGNGLNVLECHITEFFQEFLVQFHKSNREDHFLQHYRKMNKIFGPFDKD